MRGPDGPPPQRMVMTRVVRPLLGLVFVCALTLPLHGAGARFWEVATLADFLKGDVSNLSIDLHGRLVLGPPSPRSRRRPRRSCGRAWSPTTAACWSGRATTARSCASHATGALSTFFDSAELEVHALARAPGGGLYVGTSPDGRIYKVDAAGKSTPFFDPDDKYIWALAVDAKGIVYAATGDKGVIYRVTPDGKGEVFYRTKATHVRALLCGADGALLAGTESPGRVFRVTADGAGFLLLDSGLQEISALRPGARRRRLRRCALTGRGDDRPSSPIISPEPSRPCPCRRCRPRSRRCRWSSRPARSAVDPAGAARESGRASGKGAVYRIQPDGAWDQVWTSAEDAPYDVALDAGGALLVATGSKGKVYRVSRRPRADDACLRARRRSRSRPSSPTATAVCCSPRPIRPRCSACRRVPPRQGRTSRRSGTPSRWRRGARSAGGERRRLAPACGSSRVRATRRPPTTRGARGRPRTAIRTASRSRARRRATCSGRSSWPAPRAAARW